MEFLHLFRKTETSDFFDRNIGTFEAKHPYFLSKKSDVLQLPEGSLSPLQKKFFKKIPTFPTPSGETFSIYRAFRMKDRVKDKS